MSYAHSHRIWNRPSFLAFAVLLSLAGPEQVRANGFYLPSQPSGPGGQDQIESATGARCSQSVNSSGPYLDLGVGVNGAQDDRFDYYDSNRGQNVGLLGYARIIIPLGRQPERVDCIRLYELELQRLQQEVELLRMGLE